MVKLVLRQGIDAGYFWPIVDAAGAPFDLTGWSVIAQVRAAEAPDAPLLHEFTTGVLADPAPAVTISWTAEEFGTLGKRLVTGCAIGATGAMAKTDSTVPPAGVQISATYV